MRTLTKLALPPLAVCGLLLSGCYTTTLSSGKPAAPAQIEYDEKWHHGLVWGIAELSGPYDLQKACPDGWSEIKTETSFVNGFVQAVTYGIYAPQTVTVRCAAAAKPAVPSVTAAPPPPASPASTVAPAAPAPLPANRGPEPLPPAPTAPSAP